jgi:hypothetical protein
VDLPKEELPLKVEAEKAQEALKEEPKAEVKAEEPPKEAVKTEGGLFEYSKKKVGETYSQEEVDALFASFKSSIENHFTGLLTKKDQDLLALKDGIMTKLANVEKENGTLQSENESMKADQKVEEEWQKVGSSYKEEDAPVIKGILKKSFLSQTLKPEEAGLLIEKKIGTDLKIGDVPPVIKTGEITSEKRSDIIKFAGIKTKVIQQ